MVLAGYTVLAILPFYQLVFLSKVPASPDSLVPQALSMALERLQEASGLYPLWQPWVFSGMPTVEAFSYLSGLYYPNLLLSLFHPDATLLQLLHLIFAGLGVFMLLGELRLKRVAAFFGGALFMFNPFMTTMLVHGHGSQLMSAAYMPWMLWATMRLLDRGRLLDAGTLALIAGFQLQRAHVQIAWYSWLLTALLALFLIFSRRDSQKKEGGPFIVRRLLLLIVALGCGVGMSASIFLPASQYASQSVRGVAAGGGAAAWEYATLWSMHPLELLTFLVPGFFGFGGVTYWGFMPFTDFPHYAGIAVLLLAIGGAVIGRKESLTRFLLTGLCFALLLSFGSFFSPIFSLFYHAAPLFSHFRVPSMALIMLYLVLALLAARGVNELLERPTIAGLLKPLRLGALGLAVVIILFLAFEQNLEGFFRSIFPAPPVESFDLSFMVNQVRWENLKGSFWTVTLVATLSAGVVLLAVTNRLKRTVAVSLLLFVALADLLWSDLQIVNPSTASLRTPVLAERRTVERGFEPDEITRYLAAQKVPFRIYPAGPLFAENKFALSGIESVGGYHPAKLKLYEELLAKTQNLASLGVLRMLNVGYIITPQPIDHPALELVKSGQLQLATGPVPVSVYRLQGALPRAWFATRVIPVGSDDELFARLQSDDTPAGVALVDGSLWSRSRTFAPAAVTALDATAERMLLKVSAPREAFLVVSEVYYPQRWRVEIDGKSAQMVKVNGLLRGVIVPAGSREVRFTYDRSLFELGQKISLAAFIVALLMVVGGVIGRRLSRKVV